MKGHSLHSTQHDRGKALDELALLLLGVDQWSWQWIDAVGDKRRWGTWYLMNWHYWVSTNGMDSGLMQLETNANEDETLDELALLGVDQWSWQWSDAVGDKRRWGTWYLMNWHYRIGCRPMEWTVDSCNWRQMEARHLMNWHHWVSTDRVDSGFMQSETNKDIGCRPMELTVDWCSWSWRQTEAQHLMNWHHWVSTNGVDSGLMQLETNGGEALDELAIGTIECWLM